LTSAEVRPAQLLAHLADVGELPLGKVCLACGQATDEVVETVAECERLWTQERGKTSVVGLAWIFHLPLPLITHQTEERILSRGGSVPVPIRLCKSCLGTLGPSLLLSLSGPLAVLFALTGGLLLFVDLWLGAAFLTGAVLSGCVRSLVRRRRQAAIKGFLKQIPLYGQLLDEYPDARIIDTGDQLTLS
jgi:hypothetical protein